MKHRFKKWMVWSIISKCNLTLGIPNECKLCVKHVCFGKDFMYVEQNNSIYCHSNAQRMLLGIGAKDFEKN